LAAVDRRKAVGVDAAPDHLHVTKAARDELGAQVFGGHHGREGAVVELAQVGHDRFAQPAHAVVPAVGIEVGAKVRGQRQFQLVRGLQRRPAQRALGGDVHDVGSAQRPQLGQRRFGRQAHLQVRVAWDRQAAQQHFVEALAAVGLVIGLLARAYQLQVVAAVAQAFDDASDRQRHTVDFGRVGLGDDGDAQRAARGLQFVDHDIGSDIRHGISVRWGSHIVVRDCNNLMTDRLSLQGHEFVTPSSRRAITMAVGSAVLTMGPRTSPALSDQGSEHA